MKSRENMLIAGMAVVLSFAHPIASINRIIIDYVSLKSFCLFNDKLFIAVNKTIILIGLNPMNEKKYLKYLPKLDNIVSPLIVSSQLIY